MSELETCKKDIDMLAADAKTKEEVISNLDSDVKHEDKIALPNDNVVGQMKLIVPKSRWW